MAIGLKTQIWNNNLRSLLLLALYPFILLAMLWGVGAALGALSAYSAAPMAPQGLAASRAVALGNGFLFSYWPIISAAVAVWFLVSWFFHAGMIRAVSRSHPVSREEEPALYNLLENLCIARGLKMPRLEVIEDPALNAFASGISEKTYTITVTRGLLGALAPDEIEAVLGHELSHILNRDVRLLMVTVIFTGMIGFAAQMLWANLRFMIFMPRARDERRGNPVVLYLLILVILLIGYLASLLARFSLSRRREYMADAGSVELTHKPEAMIRALQRISGADRIAHVTDDVSMMCIENSKAFLGVFATHPPVESRIQALATLTGTPIPEALPRAPQNRRNPWAAH